MRWAAVTAADVLGARYAHAAPDEVQRALLLAEAVSAACERIIERAVAPRRAAVPMEVRGTEVSFRLVAPDWQFHELLELEAVRARRGSAWEPVPAEPVGPRPWRRLRVLAAHDGAVEVAGWWGMADEREPVGTLAAGVGATDTVLEVEATAPIAPGHTLILGRERAYVVGVDGRMVHVLRGQRGSEQEAHAPGSEVSIERYPPAVAAAVLVEAVRLVRDGLSGWASSVGPSELGMQVQPVYPAIVELRRTYHPTGAVAV